MKGLGIGAAGLLLGSQLVGGVPVGVAAAGHRAPVIVVGPRMRLKPSVSAGSQGFGWASSNWSGYAIVGAAGAYNSITGQWVVPAVQPSHQQTYSSSWIGIDGFNNSSLIQTGTEQDFTHGSAQYYAWWEILPAAETQIAMTVKPGDVMTAAIQNQGSGNWSITIKDVTENESFTTVQAYSGPQTSAEWIEEAPTVGGHVATLANYGKTTFDPGTVNGVNPGLVLADGGVMIQKNQQVSTPSVPDADTDGFAIAYGSQSPSAPAS